jgi:hypothetical protein
LILRYSKKGLWELGSKESAINPPSGPSRRRQQAN